VLSRQWRHVDFKKGTLRLDPGEAKNDEPREIFLTARLRQILERQKARVNALKGKGKIVPWVLFRMVANGRGGPKRPEPIASLAKWFKRASKEAGLPGRRPHDLRRSAVRNYVRSGIDTHVAMKLTGHKTESVFRRYDIISESDLRTAAERLDAVAAGS
jgi:integrase